MQVLVIGGGGREHALVWKIKQSPKVEKIFCAPGNAGTGKIAENVPIGADDIQGLLEFALKRKIGLTVVGPEQPLVMGIVDQFEKKGMIFSGISPDNKLPEIIELNNHPWFIGVQFHPEFKSRPLRPHPLFSSFIKAAKINSRK